MAKRYTAAQRKAYATGKAYKLGYYGRRIDFKPGSNLRASFDAGFKSLKLSDDRTNKRYPKIK